MKPTSRLFAFLGLALGLLASRTSAATFNYSYQFDSGLLVSGSFTGIANGDYIDNVADVTLFFNGIAMPGTLFTAAFDGTSFQNGPIVSFDPLLSNFAFADIDLAAGEISYGSFFAIYNASTYTDLAIADSPLLDVQGIGQPPSGWSVAAATPQGPVGVPDAPASVGILALGLLALAGLRPLASRDQV